MTQFQISPEVVLTSEPKFYLLIFEEWESVYFSHYYDEGQGVIMTESSNLVITELILLKTREGFRFFLGYIC